MKKSMIFRAAALLTASTLTLTGCLEEALPHGGTVTIEQVQNVSTAAENQLSGIPAYFNSRTFSSRYDFDFGIGTMIHIRDVMTQDVVRTDHDYAQWSVYATPNYFEREYLLCQLPWNYQTGGVSTCNTVLRSINPNSATDIQKGYYAAACAFRAMYYIDMMGEYEWMPSDITPNGVSPEGKDIKGLTVPIITDQSDEKQARNNPRATREQMAEFILSDLKKAEEWIPFFNDNAKNMPHLDVIYGLYARLYLWLEDYPNAEKYARMAIDAPHNNVAIVNETEATNITTGFNNAAAGHWMLAAIQTKESVLGNIRSWAAFLCNDAEWGYTQFDMVMIDASMYNRMSDTDWRKKMYKAPAGHALAGQQLWVNPKVGAKMRTYASTKFRPGNGVGNDHTSGNVVDIPLMRIEEMYFIEAEAAAHQDKARGIQLVEKFMKENRDPNYSAAQALNIVDEIVFQKRVELWGEGRTFFDVKRLNMPVTRGYKGTNQPAADRINTQGRPNWMSWQIVRSEEDANAGLRGYNNPESTAGKYTPWTE